MQDAKEEVRARLAIEDVISEYVELKRAGRNFKGLSPFTGERTPSFYVSPDKNIWHDFSSNKGGDIFSFIMEVEGLDFKAALEQLARKANVDLSMYQNANAQRVAARKKRLYDLNEASAHYFQHCLLQNQHALEYVFKKRGIDKKTATAFRLGYAPSGGNNLVKYLTMKGFSTEELRDGGVTNRFGGDLFKGRMMVPLMDASGRVIGFTGRIIIADENAPKYLNTPQTLLYDKSWHVFGLSQAKEAIRKHDYTVVVEGNMDVVSSYQAGVKQTVATAGTAMTIHHLKTLSRLSGNIRLAFDGDKAGLAATERSIPIAQEAGVSLTIISLPDNAKDPDELIQDSVEKWQAAIDASEPVIEWILRQYEKRHDITTAAGKREYTTAGLNVLRAVRDGVEQEHYLQIMSRVTGIQLETLRQKMNKTSVQSDAKKQIKPSLATIKPQQDEYRYEDDVLALMVDRPALRTEIKEYIPYFHGEKRQQVATWLSENDTIIAETAPKGLQNVTEYVKILALQADARYASWTDDEQLHETKRLLRRLKVEHKKKQKDILTQELRDAEEIGDDSRANELRSQLLALIREK